MLNKSARTSVLTVMVVLLVSGCGVFRNGAYDLPLPGGPDLGDNPYTVRVRFQDVQQLVPKSVVKVDNVKVGLVKSIEVDSRAWSAVAVCRIRGHVRLPANAHAQIRRSSLLGQSYVELRPPKDTRPHGTLTDGAVIPRQHTGSSAPVEEVLGTLSMLLNGGALPQLRTITEELNSALSGNEVDVRSLLGELNTLVSSLDASKSDIVSALEELNRLAGTLDAHREQIGRTLDELPQAIKVLADQHDELVALLDGLDRLSEVTVRVVNKSQENLVADLTALRPVLAKLEEAGKNLTEALPILATFPFTPATAQAIKGDYVNLHSYVDLNLDHLLNNLADSNQPLNINGITVPNPFSILLGDGSGDAGVRRQQPGRGSADRPAAESDDGQPQEHPAGQDAPAPGQRESGPDERDGAGGVGDLLGSLLGGTP